jgi:uncharacterized protein with GYD domain
MPLTRLSPQALHQPRSFETLERHVAQRVRERCPGVNWLFSCALPGPWDDMDVIDAPELETATRVSVLVRSHGQWHTERWTAFKALLHSTPPPG